MKILRNYILSDFATSFVFSLLSLTTVMLMGNLVKISDLIVRKGVHVLDALQIFSLYLPLVLRYTIPLAFLMGVLLTMGRLIADNELIAIRVAGVSSLRILNSFLLLGIISALLLFILNDKVMPNLHYRYRSQLKNIFSRNISSLIEPGVFLENFQNYVLFVSDKEANKLKNIYIWEVDEKEKRSKLIFAKRGEFVVEDNILKLKMEDGFRDEVDITQRKDYFQLRFKIFFMDIPIEENQKINIDKKPSDMTLAELKRKIHHLQMKGINHFELLSEIHERISFSFSVLTFIVLAFGVSLVVKHREKSINFGIAFLAAGSFYLLFILGKTLVEYQKLSPQIGMWLPNIIMGILGIHLVIKHAYSR